MTNNNYYQIAGHQICVSAEPELLTLMTNYEPFAVSPQHPTIKLEIFNSYQRLLYTEEYRQTENGQTIICGRSRDNHPVFEFAWHNDITGLLICANDYSEAKLQITRQHLKATIDTAMMILFALGTASQATVLCHAATISYQGKAYLFLGPSGTGKSTHAQLWLQHIKDTQLINDDNPVIRGNMVYGSPWSGKTPCYRQVRYPLGGLVVLSQAPHNKICRINGVQAYAALVSSISGMRWDTCMAECLNATEQNLMDQFPIWHLECLPDKEAAMLCKSTITGDDFR